MGQIAGIALVWFIIEMLIWYLISANLFSGWYVFGWFIVAIIIGIALIKKGMSVLNPFAKQMQAGAINPNNRPSEASMLKTAAMAIAGILLVIPGLLSDLLALLLLLPPIQNKIKTMANDYVMKNPEKMMAMASKHMGGNLGGNLGGMNGQNPFAGMNGGPFGSNSPFGNFGEMRNTTTVDGTAKPVHKDAKKINSANDE